MAMGGGRRGRFSVARLRRWLLAGVVLLLVALAGLIGVARWKARQLLANLPGKLGINIKSETNGFTYSQSVKGRTLFTIHAAKAIQREDGKTMLHDVAITLYGPAGSNRTDSIRGDEFEYDQPNGVIRAAGEVHLELAAPAQNGAPVKSDAKRISATTSGLIFLQKLGVAATDQPIRIDYGDLHGNATGADYETDTGILRLRSAVKMDGVQDGATVHMDAAAAEVDRNARTATLHRGLVKAGKVTAGGDTVTLLQGPGGGLQHVRAEGHAVVADATGLRAEAPSLEARLSAAGKPEIAEMHGGVALQYPGGAGTAKDGVVHFDPGGRPQTADLSGGVALRDQSPGTERELDARNVAAVLSTGASGHAALHDVTATGDAVLRSVAAGNSGAKKVSVMRATTLHAVAAGSGASRYIRDVTGSGDARLEEDDGLGNVRTSRSDTLQARLRPASAGRGGGELESAVQSGHVTVTSRSAAANGRVAEQVTATAGQADYAAAGGGRLVLTVSPLLTQSGLQLAAQRISLDQGSGEVDADGAVHGVMTESPGQPGGPNPSGSQGPVYLSADHATGSKNGSSAKFFGGKSPARMWTSTAQMAAPVIEMDRATGQLLAHAAAGSNAGGTVGMLLPMAGGASSGGGGTVRVTGSSLRYTPASGEKSAEVEATGGVRLNSPDFDVTARQATATLRAAPQQGKGGNGSNASALGGSVQTVVATGDVRLEQPGRSGRGERLLYTVASGVAELTGTPASPPVVTDSRYGKITGRTLLLREADKSVEVSGEGPRRVHTETDVDASHTGHPGLR